VPDSGAPGVGSWRPDASLEIIRLRARLLGRVRSFFAQRGVLEVDTPLLSRFAATDPALDSFPTCYLGPGAAGGLSLYLQTSPEFFLKRLLAAGSGPVYQLGHVFRNGEYGRRHNPEFMMLEWYRPGMDHHTLMDEVDALLAFVLLGILDYRPARRVAYRDWFQDHTGLDAWSSDVSALRGFVERNIGPVPAGMDETRLSPWLDLVVTHWIEPRSGAEALFVYDFPAAQAALARVRKDPVPVAERFELYFGAVELANGFHELGDAAEQRLRFEADNSLRQRSGLPAMPLDEHLLAALGAGLPDSSGVALGFDRLVMLAADVAEISAAMPFSLQRV
jgi:lysyl-tRNA synthetase class 2